MIGSRVALMGFAACCATMSPALAQDDDLMLVDRIIAVVGSSPITASRIDEEVNVIRQQGGEVPTDSAELAAFRLEVLDRIIEQELLVQAALRDTMVAVSEQELQGAVESGLQEIRNQFPSQLDYARELRRAGFDSPEDYRLWYTEQKRRELLQQALFRSLQDRGQLRPVTPTEAELRAYYDRLPQKPKRQPSVSFRQIVVPTEADSAAWMAAGLKADSLWQRLRANKDLFPELARQYSDDPGSAQRGGELGFFRRGQMVREFEIVAFRMRPGQISPPVRSPFGYHIIQVQRVEPAEVQARHILISPKIADEDRARARRIAARVVGELREGKPFDSLQRVFHDPQEQTVIENFPIQQLPETYKPVFEEASPGQVIGPVELDQGPPRPPKYAAIVFEAERPEGELTFADLRDQIRDRLSREGAFERFIEELKKKTYIDIRME